MAGKRDWGNGSRQEREARGDPRMGQAANENGQQFQSNLESLVNVI